MAISRALRFQILRRDNNTCRYCGRSAPEVKLTIDHVLPVALGGTDDAGNLATACQECNGGKSATPPDASLVAQVDEDAIRWSRARQAAADQMLAELQQREGPRQEFAERWNQWQSGGRPLALPAEWRQSVDQILSQGLPLPVLLECIDIAMRRKVKADNTFSYMCGIAWNKVKEIDATARVAVGAQSTRVADADRHGTTVAELIDMFIVWSGEHHFDDFIDEARAAVVAEVDLPAAILKAAVKALMDRDDANSGGAYSLADQLDAERVPRDCGSDWPVAVMAAAEHQLADAYLATLTDQQKVHWRRCAESLSVTEREDLDAWIAGSARRYANTGAFSYKLCGLPLGDLFCPGLKTTEIVLADCSTCERDCVGHALCQEHTDAVTSRVADGSLRDANGQPFKVAELRPIDFTNPPF